VTALQQEYDVRRSVWSDIVDHMPTLYDVVLHYPNAVVQELGTRTGNSTCSLLLAAEQVDGHVWSVDIEYPIVPPWWVNTGRWTVTVGDDLDPVVFDAQPAEVDVLFIDTSHTYDQTAAELRLYVPRVRPGGTVLLHDTELIGPDRAYIKPGGTDVDYPVARAVEAATASAGSTSRRERAAARP
jgi:predicted O-methyltransferase YrrM